MIAQYFIIGIIIQGCFAFEQRIINGQSATPHQFPHHVAIFIRKFPLTPEYLYCGGSIISNEWVLTLGQCVPKIGSLTVKAGKHYINIVETYQQDRHVIKYIVHDDYVAPDISRKYIAKNDIALLKLESPFIFTDYIKPIGLPGGANYETNFGEFCGWGSVSSSLIPKYPKELQTTKLESISNINCEQAINSGLLGDSLMEIKIYDNQMCTIYNEEDGGPCYLDSGSGFVQYNKININNTVAELVGLFSWAQMPCGKFHTPAIHTRVSSYTNWIHKNIDGS